MQTFFFFFNDFLELPHFFPLRRRLHAEEMCFKQIYTAFLQHVQVDKQVNAKGVHFSSLVRC